MPACLLLSQPHRPKRLTSIFCNRSGNVLDQIAKMMASCSEAIQDLHEKVDSLESRLAKIEARVAVADRNPSSPFRCHRCIHGSDGEHKETSTTVSARL